MDFYNSFASHMTHFAYIWIGKYEGNVISKFLIVNLKKNLVYTIYTLFAKTQQII